MLANLQRVITLLLAAAAICWLLYFRAAPVTAITGFALIVLGYTAFLALEFVLLMCFGPPGPELRPTLPELLSAFAGETAAAPRVFFWRQPFRAHAVPDTLPLAQAFPASRPGIVFVHGLFCNRGFWTPWLARLRSQGDAFIAVTLEPVFGSIDDYAPQIEAAVLKITAATGRPPLLVCHSMGGLVARAWLKRYRAEARIYHVVTIASPHHGTWLARFGRGDNSRQMRLFSGWQARLDDNMPADRHALFTCWYSNTDNIVFPALSATLPGADNRLIRGAAHVQMAFLPEVIDSTLTLLGMNIGTPPAGHCR